MMKEIKAEIYDNAKKLSDSLTELQYRDLVHLWWIRANAGDYSKYLEAHIPFIRRVVTLALTLYEEKLMGIEYTRD